MSDVEDSPRGSPQLDRTSVISRKAGAVIAGVTALLTLATGVVIDVLNQCAQDGSW